ncbi:hypothetical protein PRIPAC_92413 [Pristionchus pacificus]|uniref:receptor protein serine/threonine kinase n=1 Tax=Pristionchus pacificus TaxID=54126 RepID=A0A2A6BPN9_PRIPA|nr:hypothetical protein PRIPAC_92413 [Pristionchus pacificus]|eukprot:PDM67743.1 protein kinase [Pristionchus pacificus]
MEMLEVGYLPSHPHPESMSDAFFILLALLGGAAISLLMTFLLYCVSRSKVFRELLLRNENRTGQETIALMDLEKGQSGNEFKQRLTLGEVITNGKMSQVRRASYADPVMGRKQTVVVKTAAYRMCANSNEHIAHFLDSFNVNSIVLRYEENGCLEDYVKRVTFTPMEALSFSISLLDGLAFLHDVEREGKFPIVHRDIKSRNVLVKSNGLAALADFGLAKISTGPESFKGRYYLYGTLAYMAPELLNGQATYSLTALKKVDIYAAALVIWEVLRRTLIDDEDEPRAAEIPYTSELQEEIEMDEELFHELNEDPKEIYARKSDENYLKRIVFEFQQRPVISERLRSDPITEVLSLTIQQMWCHDEEGRPSASYVLQRLNRMKTCAINGDMDDIRLF